MAPPEMQSNFCLYPNYFSNVLTPAVEKRLPTPGSLSARTLDHLTNVGSFVQTVSQDLCDDGRMSVESTKSATSFITRSATSATVVGGTLGLAATGLALGSPVGALVAGGIGLAVLPYLAERAVFGVADFFGELLNGVEKRS
jgi:hypothetical protein